MRVQILEDISIPEGYTYKRCDQYTPEEFLERYTDDNGKVSQYYLEYVAANPKDVYTAKDVIEIREMAKVRQVGSLMDSGGRSTVWGVTTKRYDPWRTADLYAR